MKEALGLYGNELNYLDTTFRVGYAIFLIPSQIILTKIRPSYWLPGLEVSRSPPTSNRFFVGLA